MKGLIPRSVPSTRSWAISDVARGAQTADDFSLLPTIRSDSLLRPARGSSSASLQAARLAKPSGVRSPSERCAPDCSRVASARDSLRVFDRLEPAPTGREAGSHSAWRGVVRTLHDHGSRAPIFGTGSWNQQKAPNPRRHRTVRAGAVRHSGPSAAESSSLVDRGSRIRPRTSERAPHRSELYR